MLDDAGPITTEAGPLDWLVFAEMMAVNQVLTHGMVMRERGLHRPAEFAYDVAVASMNRSMRLMLARQADGRSTRFVGADAPRGLGILRIDDDPATALAADARALQQVVEDYDARMVEASGVTRATMARNRAEVADQHAELARFAQILADQGEDALRSDRADRDDGHGIVNMRQSSRRYYASWGQFDRTAPGEPVAMPWAGTIVGILASGMIQVFAHGFGHRALGRIDLANQGRVQSLVDMRAMYVLLTLALERGLPTHMWRPDGEAYLTVVAADEAGMIAADRAYSAALVSAITRAEPDWRGDPVAAPILQELRQGHLAFADDLGRPAPAGAMPKDDIAGMLVRWGIDDPTA